MTDKIDVTKIPRFMHDLQNHWNEKFQKYPKDVPERRVL